MRGHRGGTDLAPRASVSAQNSTVDRALRVLQVFLDKGNDLGVLEIAATLDLDKSVVHRILATLVRRRFLEQDHATRKYRVGLRVWELGRLYVSGVQLEELAMERLTTLMGGLSYTTGALSILDGAEVVVLTCVRGPGPFNITLEPGLRLPAALTATGRAMWPTCPPGSWSPCPPTCWNSASTARCGPWTTCSRSWPGYASRDTRPTAASTFPGWER